MVLLVEAGTHLIVDALMCPYRIGERVRALKLHSEQLPNILQADSGNFGAKNPSKTWQNKSQSSQKTSFF
ncbi:hypothetical protein IQ275_33735 [Nostoc sp. LEGE 12450]|nr:hypothetical protein [Nostoc sp. LEGE 12450]